MRQLLPEPYTFFLDECLGKHRVAAYVRPALLPEERQRRWVVLSEDAAVRRRPNQRKALIVARVALFLVANGRADEVGPALARSLPTIRRALRAHEPAVIARLDRQGKVTVSLSRGQALANPKVLKPHGTRSH